MADDTDLERLRVFLGHLQEDLDLVISESPNLLVERLRDIAQKAWYDVRDRIGTAIRLLEHGGPGDPLPENRQRLDNVALSGNSLEWKLTGYDSARAAFEYARAGRKPIPGLLKPLLHKVLGWMNAILGSLVAALPVLEPIKEVKESLEQSLA